MNPIQKVKNLYNYKNRFILLHNNFIRTLRFDYYHFTEINKTIDEYNISHKCEDNADNLETGLW